MSCVSPLCVVWELLYSFEYRNGEFGVKKIHVSLDEKNGNENDVPDASLYISEILKSSGERRAIKRVRVVASPVVYWGDEQLYPFLGAASRYRTVPWAFDEDGLVSEDVKHELLSMP